MWSILSADGMKKFTAAAATLNKGENSLSYGTATADSYTPATTNWNGYDTYYAFGQWKTVPEGVTTGNNTWTKVSVIPANNVYYEDDFITDASTGKVGIEYTGTWETDGTASGNKETATHRSMADGRIQILRMTQHTATDLHTMQTPGMAQRKHPLPLLVQALTFIAVLTWRPDMWA